MPIKYLKSAPLRGKTVLLRADMNVPLNDRGEITDDYRIRVTIPTIEYLAKQGCKIIICSHLGRPKEGFDPSLTLRAVAKRTSDLLKYKFLESNDAFPNYLTHHLIFFTGNIEEERARTLIQKASNHDIVFLENIRFYNGEQSKNIDFAKLLASMADFYVNEAFSVDHHGSASLSVIENYVPSYAGLLLEKEIKNLRAILDRPKSPFVVMMGGIKISDKAKTLENLGKRADKILLGGGLANLFFFAKDLEIGLSKVERESRDLAWQMSKNFQDKIVLPSDLVVANKEMSKDSVRVTDPTGVKHNEIILDVGPKTILKFAKILKTAHTVVWNGPLGLFEVKPFHTATFSLARVIGGISGRQCFSIVGGGETVDAVHQAHQQDFIDHVSTGGGAMLEFLAGNKLPGLEALEK